MTFPSAPINGQHYLEPTTKQLYEFDETNREWINLSKRGILNTTGYVPIMTSNSQDGFITSGSSRFSASYDYYMAFDGNNSTAWAISGTSNMYLQVTFPQPEIVWKVYFSSRETGATGEGYIKWALQYYDDTLNEWLDWNHQRFDMLLGYYKYFSNPIAQVASSQWRLYCWEGASPNTGIRTAQFYVKTI